MNEKGRKADASIKSAERRVCEKCGKVAAITISLSSGGRKTPMLCEKCFGMMCDLIPRMLRRKARR